MIDSHTHLYFPEYGEEIIEIMKRCAGSGVVHLILPNVDEESIEHIKSFHSRYPSNTSMAIGLHPTEVKDDWVRVMKVIETELTTGEYIAIGEVGMDLYWDSTFIENQKKAFEYQLKLAEHHHIPVIIHCRSALDETLEVIERVKPTVPLIFHSFTGSTEDVIRIRKSCDPYFGINGVVTYKNAEELRKALPIISLDRIILETDSPFLTPVPHRGKRNDSSYLYYIRDKIAETLGVSADVVETTTDFNARTIFGL